MRVPVLACLVLLLPIPLAAQDLPDERLHFERPESWAMARLVSLTLFTGMGGFDPPPGFRIGGEAGWIPALSAEERTVGFHGTKEEDMNKTPLLGRIRVGYASDGGWQAELGVVPPLEVGGARPMLLAGALGRTLPLPGRVTGRIRVHGQVGGVRGDITCPEEVVAASPGSAGNPFGCERPSRDRVSPAYAGVEVAGSRAAGEWRPWAGLSVQRHRPSFEVDARYSGLDDRRTLTTRGTGWAFFGGVGREIARIPVGVEVFWAPLEVRRRADLEVTREGVWNVRASAAVPW